MSVRSYHYLLRKNAEHISYLTNVTYDPIILPDFFVCRTERLCQKQSTTRLPSELLNDKASSLQQCVFVA
jgi:hypothetical protein